MVLGRKEGDERVQGMIGKRGDGKYNRERVEERERVRDRGEEAK